MGLLCCFCAGSIHFMTSYSAESILLPIQHYFNSAVSIKFTSDDRLTSCTGLSSPVVLRRLITISIDPGPERASLAASGTKGTIKAEVVVHVQYNQITINCKTNAQLLIITRAIDNAINHPNMANATSEFRENANVDSCSRLITINMSLWLQTRDLLIQDDPQFMLSCWPWNNEKLYLKLKALILQI